MDHTEDYDEPLGEYSDLTIPRVARLVDRQATALAEIRGHLDWIDALKFGEHTLDNGIISGRQQTASTIRNILERNQL